MIKTTLRKIVIARQALGKFGELPFDMRTKFENGKLLDTLTEKLQIMDKLKKDAVVRHEGVVDENTNEVTFPKPGARAAFNAEWENLLDKEIELDYEPVQFGIFERLAESNDNVEFSANDFSVIRWMISN